MKGQVIELLKPQTFVNSSGLSVAYAYKKHSLKPDDLYVIHDDLDISLGNYKIQKGKGPKVHKGIKSVNEALGTRDYWRVRVGVENRLRQIQNPKSKTQKISGERYVLQNFTDKELEILKPVIDKIVIDLINQLTN
jgi:PTH1 family peptidyl-tRNA hydrolase